MPFLDKGIEGIYHISDVNWLRNHILSTYGRRDSGILSLLLHSRQVIIESIKLMGPVSTDFDVLLLHMGVFETRVTVASELSALLLSRGNQSLEGEMRIFTNS